MHGRSPSPRTVQERSSPFVFNGCDGSSSHCDSDADHCVATDNQVKRHDGAAMDIHRLVFLRGETVRPYTLTSQQVEVLRGSRMGIRQSSHDRDCEAKLRFFSLI
jgi:hypothetical protein